MVRPVREIRVVVVGLGRISTEWLTALGEREDLYVVGLVDPDATRANTQRSDFGLACAVHTDLARAINEERANLVVNLTPPALHRGVSEAALNAGCDVIVEKPMTAELSDAVALVSVARASDRTLAVMQNRRYHPAVRRMREEVRKGTIGDLVDASVDMFLWHRFSNTFLSTIDSPLLRDMAIHQFDAARAITGVDAVTVQALEWGSPTTWMQGAAAAVAAFELSGGAVFSYRGSWVAEGASTSYDGSWRVGGTSGSITWDGQQQLTLDVISRPDGPHEPGTTRREMIDATPVDRSMHASGLAAILDAIQVGKEPETAAVDNLMSLAMVDAAIRSSRLRRTVALADVLDEARWSG